MQKPLVPLKFDKITQTPTYSCIVLSSEEKTFGIYTSHHNTKTLQDNLTDTTPSRPSTHELIERIFLGLEIKCKHILINEIEDSVYFARLFLEQRKGDILQIVEIDARPSDCITLAHYEKIPIYCTSTVIEKAIPYIE